MACRRAMLWRDPALLTACLVGLLLVLIACEKKEAPAPMGPPEVLVAEVAQQNVPVFEEWVAQLNGPVNADITPKVQGYLLKQDYQNGSFVNRVSCCLNSILVNIRPQSKRSRPMSR